MRETSDNFQEVGIYVNGARMAQFGLRGYFLKSSQANFCQIRYSSCVCGVQLKQMIQINKFLENGDTVLMIVNQQLAKQPMNLDPKKRPDPALILNFEGAGAKTSNI